MCTRPNKTLRGGGVGGRLEGTHESRHKIPRPPLAPRGDAPYGIHIAHDSVATPRAGPLRLQSATRCAAGERTAARLTSARECIRTCATRLTHRAGSVSVRTLPCDGATRHPPYPHTLHPILSESAGSTPPTSSSRWLPGGTMRSDSRNLNGRA